MSPFHAADDDIRPTVSIHIHKTDLTADTGIGNPKQATREKGVVYLDKVIDKIAEFLSELSQTDPDDIYI